MNVIHEVYEKISKDLANSYDDLIFSMIEQYGITRETWRDHIDRIMVIQTGWNKHFYIDNMYAFSIMEKDEFIFDDAKCEYKARVTYRVEVIESMIGANNNESFSSV